MKRFSSLPVRTLGVIAGLIGISLLAGATLGKNAWGAKPVAAEATAEDPHPGTVFVKDSVGSVKAFAIVYKVLMSPRCMNCHPSGDVPLQGDDSHLHIAAPKRGKDGKGMYAMKCSNCHQPENTPGVHTPPGNPNWHLPPADMKMVFEGRTARQLAKQLLDPATNGHKDMKALLEHANDGLVKAGWNMGGDRSKPPVTHAVFAKAWTDLLTKGAYAPSK